MSDLSPSASVAKLLESPEDQLYQELGIRARAIAADPSLSGSFEPNVIHDAKLMGPLDDIKDLGRRIFRRWNREAYDLICGGDPVDEKDREKVRNSFGLGDAAVAGSISALLIGSFGVAPTIATVIAALIIKRFFRPAYEETCNVWKEKLGAE